MRQFLATASAVVVGVIAAHTAIWAITPQPKGYEIREQLFRGTKMFWVYEKGWPRDHLIGGADSLGGARDRLKRERATGDERVVETIP